MQRNTLFGGLALMLAGGVIGAGAMISSNAMADTEGAPPANELTMINVGADGDVVKCTFDGADVQGMLPAFPSTAPTGALPADVAVGGSGGGVFTVSGIVPGGAAPIEIDPNNPPEGVQISSGTITVDGSVSPGELPVIASSDAVPADVRILSADDARDGTPEECAAMQDGAVAMAVQGATQVINGSASVNAGGSATKP